MPTCDEIVRTFSLVKIYYEVALKTHTETLFFNETIVFLLHIRGDFETELGKKLENT